VLASLSRENHEGEAVSGWEKTVEMVRQR